MKEIEVRNQSQSSRIGTGLCKILQREKKRKDLETHVLAMLLAMERERKAQG